MSRAAALLILAPGCTPTVQPSVPSQDKTPMTAPASRPTSAKSELATFGAGCFWCVEAVYLQIPGVLSVRSGYMGGRVDKPTYKQVCSGTTGHAEVVQLVYDPAKVEFATLLKWFFALHDPTTLNRQGADEGTQYRSAIFFHDQNQKDVALRVKRELDASGEFDQPIVTEVTPASTFWVAEDYHQAYYEQNKTQPYCRAVIRPKLEKLKLKY